MDAAAVLYAAYLSMLYGCNIPTGKPAAELVQPVSARELSENYLHNYSTDAHNSKRRQAFPFVGSTSYLVIEASMCLLYEHI